MANISAITTHLNGARSGLEAVLGGISAENWRRAPGPGRWSAAEVVAHLTMVERAINDGADKALRSQPRPTPFWKRIHVPVRAAAWRGIKRRTPIPLDATLVEEREPMLAKLAAVRERTLRLLNENRDRDLSAYCRKLPFFGVLNLYEWFWVVGYHERRHTEQLREIVDSFHG